jgi:hypothetical protein
MLEGKMKEFYGSMSLEMAGVALVGTPSSDLDGSGLSIDPALN